MSRSGAADIGAAIQRHFIKVDTNGDQLVSRKEIKLGVEMIAMLIYDFFI